MLEISELPAYMTLSIKGHGMIENINIDDGLIKSYKMKTNLIVVVDY